ncbi:MAG: SPOR domain-containing protein [Cardiobacterium sp.]
MAKKPNKPDNYLAARFLGGSMMAVVLIVFGFVLGNMFGQKDGNSRSDDANPQIAKAQPAAAAKPARPAIASTPRKSGQPKYSFYNELQRRSEEVRAEAAAPAAKTDKPAAAKTEKKPRPPTVKGANYRIQVGAFKDKTQAEQMRKKAALGDLPVEIIYGENKHYLVLVGPYASKDQAIGIQKKLEGQNMSTLLKTYNNAP